MISRLKKLAEKIVGPIHSRYELIVFAYMKNVLLHYVNLCVYIYTHLYVCIHVFLHVLMYCSIAYGQPMKQRNS